MHPRQASRYRYQRVDRTGLAGLDLSPGRVDPGVPLVGELGLTGVHFHDLESGVGNQLGDSATERRT
jgi:hypothetical protein